MNTGRIIPLRSILLLALAGASLLLSLSGCATMAEGTESDIPWNQPQPWEGAPGLPGMSQ